MSGGLVRIGQWCFVTPSLMVSLHVLMCRGERLVDEAPVKHQIHVCSDNKLSLLTGRCWQARLSGTVVEVKQHSTR